MLQSFTRQGDRRVLIVAVLALLVGGIVMTMFDPALDVPPWLGILGGLAVALVVAGSIVRAHRRDLMAPTVFFPIVVLAYYWLGSLPVGSWGHVGGGMNLVILIAVAAFVLGASIVGDDRDGSPLPSRRSYEFNERRLIRSVLLVGALSLLGFGVIWAATGIPILGFVEGARVQASASGYVNTLALTIRAVVMVAFVVLLSPVRLSRRGRVVLGVVVVVGVVLVATTGNRGHLVLLAIFAVAALHYLIRPVPMKAVLGLASIGLIGFSAAGYIRAAQCDTQWAEGVEDLYGVPATLAPLAPAYLSIRSVPVFLNAVIDEVPEGHGHTYGAMLISPLMTPLPGHQPGIGEFIKANVLRLEFVGFGVAAGLLSPAYIDFGYLGIVAMLLAAGAACQWLYRRARSGGLNWLAVYAFIVANLTLSVYGSLVNSFSVLWIPCVVFVILTISREPAAGERLLRVDRGQVPLRLATMTVLLGFAVLTVISTGTVIEAVARASVTGTPIVIDLPGSADPSIDGEGEAPVIPNLGCKSRAGR